MALTDHDTVNGLDEAFSAGDEFGVEIVPGIEFSTIYEGNGVHVLCYFMDDENPELAAELRRLQDDRYRRGEMMVEKLQELGYPITFERVREIAEGGNIVRPHVAQALVEAGVVADDQGRVHRGVHRVERPRVRREARAASAGRAAADPFGRRRVRPGPPRHVPRDEAGAADAHRRAGRGGARRDRGVAPGAHARGRGRVPADGPPAGPDLDGVVGLPREPVRARCGSGCGPPPPSNWSACAPAPASCAPPPAPSQSSSRSNCSSSVEPSSASVDVSPPEIVSATRSK